MSATPRECLTDEEVTEVTDGLLARTHDARAKEIRAHIDSCVECQRLVAACSEPSDALAQTVAATGATAADVALSRGASLGRYLVLDKLGEGGMGVVYAAYDPELDRKVAVKVLRAGVLEGRSGTDGRARLMREAQAMARLAHPNVIPVHDVGTHGDQVFVAMERVDGGTARAWATKPRSWQEVLGLYVQAGRGLAAAHDAGIIHRDFKPDNVLVGSDGRARVVDFGLAHAGEGSAPPRSQHVGAMSALSTPLTREGEVVGTPRYMAPEQLEGERTDAASDQFSFCASLYEALYGEPPFAGDDLSSLVSNVRSGKVRQARAGSRVPGWVRQTVKRGLSLDAKDRWPSMHELLAALERDPARARRRYGGIVAAVVAFSAASLGVVLARGHRPPLCPSAEPELAGAWGSSEQLAVRDAFRATGAPYADGAYAELARALDAYGAAWVRMRHDACEATLVRGQQSSDLMDLRMACLDGRLVGLRALASALEHVDRKGVEQAAQATSALAPLVECADATALHALPLPDDPAKRSAIKALRGELAQVTALAGAAKPKEALPRAAEAVRTAEAIGYLPLKAEALEVQGSLLDVSGDDRQATAVLEQAALTAVATRDEAVETRARIELVRAYGNDQRPPEARAAARLAHACVDRGGDRDEDLADLLQADGIVAFKDGNYVEARDADQRALAIRERTLPPDDPQVAAAVNLVGNVAQHEGEFAAALAYHQRALGIRERALGPAHPQVAGSLNNIGLALRSLGDREGALAAYRRSLEIKIGAYGEDSRQVADTLSNMAFVLQDLDRMAEYVATEERVLAIRLRILEPNHSEISEAYLNLADAQLGTNRLDDALANAKRALEVGERAYGKDDPKTAPALTVCGEALLLLGRPRDALSYLERALPLAEARSEPSFLAGTRHALALALVRTNGDAKRARELVRLARAEFVAEGVLGEGPLKQLNDDFPQWR